jgi:hypothetical protein
LEEKLKVLDVTELVQLSRQPAQIAPTQSPETVEE